MKIFIALLAVIALLFVCGIGAGATRGTEPVNPAKSGVPDVMGLFTRKVNAGELELKSGCQKVVPIAVAAGSTCVITLKATGVFGLRRMSVELLGSRLDAKWGTSFVNNVSIRNNGTVDLIFTNDETPLTLSGCVPLSAALPCTLTAK